MTRDSDAAHLPAADPATPREDHGVALEAGALRVLAVAEHPCSGVRRVSCLIYIELYLLEIATNLREGPSLGFHI